MCQPLGFRGRPPAHLGRSRTPRGPPTRGLSWGMGLPRGRSKRWSHQRRERLFCKRPRRQGAGHPGSCRSPPIGRWRRCQPPGPSRSHDWERVSDQAPPSGIPGCPQASPQLQCIPATQTSETRKHNKRKDELPSSPAAILVLRKRTFCLVVFKATNLENNFGACFSVSFLLFLRFF